jgi:hypothetical protein
VDWWAWRLAFMLMCLCISTIIISCAASNPSPVLTPVELPPITLTLWIAATSTPLFSTVMPVTATPAPIFTQTPLIYIVNPGESVEEIAGDFGIEPGSLQIANPELQIEPPKVGQSVIVPRGLATLPPIQVELIPPTCYPTPSDMLLCMGYVRNTSLQPVERVSALIELMNRDGQLIAEEVVALEQRVILPGDAAPYRVLFREQPYHQMIVSLLSADPSENTSGGVRVFEESVSQNNGDYIIEASLISDADVSVVRVVATVYNRSREVVGYRIMDTEGMDANTSRRVRIAVQPITTSDILTHALYVEGRSSHPEDHP